MKKTLCLIGCFTLSFALNAQAEITCEQKCNAAKTARLAFCVKQHKVRQGKCNDREKHYLNYCQKKKKPNAVLHCKKKLEKHLARCEQINTLAVTNYSGQLKALTNNIPKACKGKAKCIKKRMLYFIKWIKKLSKRSSKMLARCKKFAMKQNKLCLAGLVKDKQKCHKFSKRNTKQCTNFANARLKTCKAFLKLLRCKKICHHTAPQNQVE